MSCMTGVTLVSYSFDNVALNLKLGRYRGRIAAADYVTRVFSRLKSWNSLNNLESQKLSARAWSRKDQG